MFPQSELDNYKLQVELLEEKLQRSEISRQQLEHKLDKILQKRDEHDKIVRSKTKQKYQKFLEEQQRRNERNKQLVQMLERIEQQTEVMNARSERLKMMKLQYEMYFAKLVHSQTRRCIQNSVTPITQMMPMPTTSNQYITQNINPNSEPTIMEGYNYMTNVEAAPTQPLIVNSYQKYVTTPNVESQQFLKTQQENIPLEMPTLRNFGRSDITDCIDFKNLSVAPSIPTQQSHQYQAKYEAINKNEATPTNSNFYKQEITVPTTTSINNSISLSSEANLLPKDKQFTEFKETSNLSTPISSTFGKIPNVNMMSQNSYNIKDIPNHTPPTITKTHNITNNSDVRLVNGNLLPVEIQSQNMNQMPLASTNQIDKQPSNAPQNNNPNGNIVNSLSQKVIKDIINPVVNTVDEVKPEAITPKPLDKPTISSEKEPAKSLNKTSTSFSNNTAYVKNSTELNEHKNLANTSLDLSNSETNTSATPVSIENIENAIYGELLSPLETEEVPKTENSTVAPKLLENLVTQPENVEIDNNPLDEPTLEQDKVPDSNLGNDVKNTTGQNVEQNQDSQNYEQTLQYDEYNKDQQPQQDANNVTDYNYQNVEGTTIDESQQQQQYDYSNYDPTQYSYPGYIYDETTGEYKPDPNAPAEQYATDQQYTTDGYDQQYQQQDVYDYNQTYGQDSTTPTTNVENTNYNNYETSQEDNISNNLQDSNVEQPDAVAEAETTQPEITPDESIQPSTKVIKPTSILSTADKNDSQKKKKRVNFVDSSETDESAVAVKEATSIKTSATGNVAASSESDFDFSSSTEADAKAT